MIQIGNPFERRIVSKTLNIDGTADVVYECGHEATWIIPPTGDTTPCCAECVEEFRKSRQPK